MVQHFRAGLLTSAKTPTCNDDGSAYLDSRCHGARDQWFWRIVSALEAIGNSGNVWKQKEH